MPLCQTGLGNRSAFAAGMMEGKGVVESQPKGSAAAETRDLAAEIAAILALPVLRAAQ